MSLPSEWVDKIFRKMTLAYGRDLLNRWEGLDMRDVKTDWMHELSGYENAPECIAYALQNLPASKPPTVYEFRELCRRAPRKEPLQISRAVDPTIQAEALRALAPVRQRQAEKKDFKAWAKALKARHEAGEKLTPIQIEMYRSALKLDLIPGCHVDKREVT